MKFHEIYAKNPNEIKFSFEVFPPADAEKLQRLKETLEKLSEFKPKFVSLTWGAGGKSNQAENLISDISAVGFDVMPHFTCVCSTKEYVEYHLEKLENLDIDKILALRGDIPEDKSLMHHEFHYACDLVEFIKNKSHLDIAVAGYPEGHIETPDLNTDLANLKKKVDKGANAIFTQMFFDNNKLYKYIEKVHNIGIDLPIIPGIMPILSKKQIDKMTNLARISIPKNLQNNIEKYQNSGSDMQKFGIEYATTQCQDLISQGIKNLHFYTLNKSTSIKQILYNIL